MRSGNGDYWDRLNSFLITEDAYQAEEERNAREEQCDAAMADAEVVAVELEAEFEEFVSHLRALELPDGEAPEGEACRVMFREISAGLIARGEIKPFVIVVAALRSRCPAPFTDEELEYSFAWKKPLFEKVGVLNDRECGTFWLKIISRLPSVTDGESGGELDDLLALAEKFYSDFAGEGAADIDLAGKFAAHRRRFAAMRARGDAPKES